MIRRVAGVVGVLGLVGVPAVVVHRSGALDDTPPVLSLEVPQGVVRGHITIALAAVDAQPGVATMHLVVDDGPPTPASNGPLTLDTTTLSDGPHTVVLRASDHAWTPNSHSVRATFTVDNTPPAFQWTLVPAQPAQGEVAAVYLWSDEPLSHPAFKGIDQARLFRSLDSRHWRVLVGVGVTTPPGPTTVDVHVADLNGNALRCTIPVDIQATTFPRGGTIRLSKKQVKARKDTEALAQMKADRTAAYTHIEARSRWSGATLRPVAGRRTSGFGRYRTYSDGRKKHHLGTDLANLTGTPVKAALAGEVRAAGWQHLFGNAVILHHGQGLTTSYNHLSEINVSMGDVIDQGTVVGALGSTGQSTGPHLHWGMQVGEVEVDPERWPDHGFQLPAVSEHFMWHTTPDCVRVE